MLKRTIYAFAYFFALLLSLVWVPITVSIFIVSLPAVYILSGNIYEDFWLDLFYLPLELCLKIGRLIGLEN